MPISVGKQRGLYLASKSAYRKTSRFSGTLSGEVGIIVDVKG